MNTGAWSIIEKALPIGVIVVVFLLGAVALSPFIPALLWSVFISVALLPVHARLTRLFDGRRSLASVATALGLILIVVLPMLFLLRSIIAVLPELAIAIAQDQSLQGFGLDLPAGTPATWRDLWSGIQDDLESLRQLIGDDLRLLMSSVIFEGRLIGHFILEFLLGLLLAAMILQNAETLGRLSSKAAEKLGGARGLDLGTALAAPGIRDLPAWIAAGGTDIDLGAPRGLALGGRAHGNGDLPRDLGARRRGTFRQHRESRRGRPRRGPPRDPRVSRSGRRSFSLGHRWHLPGPRHTRPLPRADLVVARRGTNGGEPETGVATEGTMRDYCRATAGPAPLQTERRKAMPGTTRGRGADELEEQFQVIRDDITKLTKLLQEIGEAKAGETRDKALAEAKDLLEQSRSALDEGRLKARNAAASVEDYINEKPVQSALIALGVGFLVGMMTRR